MNDMICKYKKLIEEISHCSVVKNDECQYMIRPLSLQSQSDWGFVEWSILELGNGDYCGFYWKLGGENKNPIVCALHHDDGELLPWASSMQGFFDLIAANEDKNDDLFEGNFWFSRKELRETFLYYGHEVDFPSLPKLISLKDALTIDDMSPICLKYMGDQYRQENNFECAKNYYLKALSSLPEYGEVSFALAMLYRSLQQDNLAIPYFIDAFTSPFYFCKEHEKSLRILSLYYEDDLYELNDPIWKRRHLIKLDDGEKYPNFHRIANEVIEEYMTLKEYRRAIGFRIFMGIFATGDIRLTHRYQLSDHQKLLRQNLQDAGLGKRIALLGL